MKTEKRKKRRGKQVWRKNEKLSEEKRRKDKRQRYIYTDKQTYKASENYRYRNKIREEKEELRSDCVNKKDIKEEIYEFN